MQPVLLPSTEEPLPVPRQGRWPSALAPIPPLAFNSFFLGWPCPPPPPAALQDVLENHRVVWLLANTVNERTYLATKRLRDSGAAGDGSGPGANECP